MDDAQKMALASAILSVFGGPMLASANLDRAEKLIDSLDNRGLQIVPRDGLGCLTMKMCEALARAEAAEAEVARLRRIIDSRPAINAGLPETYIEWSQSIYTLDAIKAGVIPQQ